MPRFLLVFSCCLLCGCSDIVKTGMSGVMQAVGAQAVEGCSDEDLVKMFKRANDACPTRMDAFTTLEEVKLIDQGKAEFRYIVNHQGKQLLTRIDKQTLKKSAVEHMKGNAMAVAVAQRDLSIEHIYEDTRGNHLLSYTINREVLEGNLSPVGDERSNPFTATTVRAEETESVLEDQTPSSATAAPQTISKPMLPQQINSPNGREDNPAGIHGNPFVSET